MTNLHQGYIAPLLLALIALLLLGGGAYVYQQAKPTSESVTATSTTQTSNPQTVGWKTYTDPNNRFSVEYPSTLIVQSEKSARNQVDTVLFQSSPTATEMQIGIFNANSRWPDLRALVNDQYLISKGGDDPVPIYRTLPSGLVVQDVGTQVVGRTFVGQFNAAQFIVFSFKDENLVDQALSSFKLLTNFSAQSSIIITTPNGGEVWQKGVYYPITWTADTGLQMADIYLVPLYATVPCEPRLSTGEWSRCPAKPYLIVDGFESRHASYSWVAGKISTTGSIPDSFLDLVKESFTIKICKSGTDICDSSDAPFTIFTFVSPAQI